MRTTCLTATLIAILTAIADPAAAQSSGTDLVLEGNALARDGLYHAALLRYREAAAAGVDTPLFHYNLGVVYYRLGRYDDAAAALAIARGDPRLAAIATYNLALAELARGDRSAAAAAFQAVVDMGADRPLRRAARDGLGLIERDGARVADAGSEPIRGPAAAAGGFRFGALASYAQDSNVYRAPAEPYVDLADPAAPVITPVVYSAGFMPVDLYAAYVLPNEAEDTEFVFGYAMSGDFYDSEFSNANRVTQQMSIGADIDMEAVQGRHRHLDSAFYVETHDETNFNPDDGLDRNLAGTDLADRLSFRGAGIRADYGHEIGRYLFGFEIEYERRQYEDPGLLPNYDHDNYDNRAFVDIEIGARNELGFGIRRLRRIYDERRSRELTGALSIDGTAVEYDYRGIDLEFRRMLGTRLVVEAGLSRLERTDMFVGYHDYVQDIASLSLTYQPGDRLRLAARVSAHTYEFPNAFAFNNPLAGARELDVSRADLELEYVLTDKLALTLAVAADDSTASDDREQYDRSVASLGVRWRR